MTKISLNILPGLKKWFVEKTNILTAWNTTLSDSQIPSEKLVKTELDTKAVKTDMDTALGGKIDKTSIKTVVNDTLTNNDVVGGKAVYDEIKKVEAGIPSGMKHTDITDWDTATAGFEKGANKTTTISSDNASDTKYPTEKAVKLAIGDLQAHVEANYPLKTSVNADLNTKIDKTSISTSISETSGGGTSTISKSSIRPIFNYSKIECSNSLLRGRFTCNRSVRDNLPCKRNWKGQKHL